MMKNALFALAAGAVVSASALADVEVILVAESGNDTIGSLDPATGFEINLNLINLPAVLGATGMLPKDVIQVGDEIWISDQNRDRLYRFTATVTPAYLGEVTGALDNIRGMAYDAANDAVWVSNAGTQNGAPGAALVRVQASTATIVGSFPVGDPFDVYVLPSGNLLVSDIDSDDLVEYTTGGALVGTFGTATGLNFPQQISTLGNNYVVAGFSTTTGVYEFSSTGSFIQRYATGGGPRGVAELDDGTFIVSSGTNVIRFANGTPTNIISLAGSSFQYFARVTLSDGGSACPSDFNGDTFVDDTDFVTFAAAYEAFTIPPADPAADLNNDGFVDDADFVEFAAAYEAFVCP